VLTPTGRDAALTRAVLARELIESAVCNDVDELCDQMTQGAGAVLLAEEALTPEAGSKLVDWLAGQPTWSDLPLLLMARSGADSATVARAIEQLGNVTVLERPVRVATLMSAVRTAIRSRLRQYQTRENLNRIAQSERDLRDLFDNATVGLHFTGPDGIILRVNRTELRMLGYAEEEYVGHHVAEFHADAHVIADILARLGAGETVTDREARMRCKDGSIKLVHITENVLWKDGRFVHTRCFTRDISNRLETEAAAAQLAAIVASSDDAIISKTLEGTILTWNAGAQRLFGYTAAEAIGRPITMLIPPERQDEEPALLERLRAGQHIEHFETVRVTKDGRRLDISLTVSPVRDGEGRVVGASKVARDITERKQAEAALREANRRKDEFLAMLAHELRNPLAPIRNSVHVLRMTSEVDSSASRIVEMMERQVNHMVRLVDDLMEISRITRGKIELRKERVELARVVRSAVETSRPLIDAAGHQLTVDLPTEPLGLQGDAVRLAQVIANLLNNAAKYTDAGGHIWLSVYRDGGSAVIAVRDTGIGIPQDMLPRVFDLFMQVDRQDGIARGGLGIGLALVKSLVEMHGGSVEARSAGPGRGSEFVVRLPVAASQDPADAPASTTRPSAILAARRVLVVDDNRDAAQSLAMLLRLLGADVHVAYSGAEALAVLPTFKPAAVLLDIGMPGMDGHEVARRIRSQPAFRGVKLIALTGWGQVEDRNRSKSAGFDHHLIKPADVRALQGLLTSTERSP
jgi:PAS domain S-box-containing protein